MCVLIVHVCVSCTCVLVVCMCVCVLIVHYVCMYIQNIFNRIAILDYDMSNFQTDFPNNIPLVL